MKRVLLVIGTLSAACLAGDWTTVGGNSMHNGLSAEEGPLTRMVWWEAYTPPSTLGMQTYTCDSFAVTMRYDFGAMLGTLACHSISSGETLWTRLYGRPDSTRKILAFGFRDGRIFARNFQEQSHDTLYCIDPTDGSVLWQSRFTVARGISWSASFTDDGDLIVPSETHGLMRIDIETGDTVWTCPRPLPNTGAEGTCVRGNTIYSWEGYINRPKQLLAIDATNGHILFRSAEIPGDGDQEYPMAVSPDGTIYFQRDGGQFYALTDIDTAFVTKWTSTTGGSVWGNYGVMNDMSVLVPRGRRLYRLDPANGATLDSTVELVTSDVLTPRVSIDRHDAVFVLASNSTGGCNLWALDRNLDTVWHEDYPYAYYSGPALCQDLVMIMSGAGTTMRAYLHPMAVAESPSLGSPIRALSASPNPFRTRTSISLQLTADSPAGTAVFDASGRRVRSLALPSSPAPRTYSLSWDGTDDSGRRLPTGVYFLRTSERSLPLTLTD